MIEFSQEKERVKIVLGPGTSKSKGQKTEHGILGERGSPETRSEKQDRETEEASSGALNSVPRGRGVPEGPGHRRGGSWLR